jgi:TP901 family phage tail tape measure protein
MAILSINIIADATRARGVINGLGGEFGRFGDDVERSGSRFGSVMGNIGRVAAIGAAAAGTAIAGLAVDGTKQFMAFEKSMNEVFTLIPGASASAMDEMEDQVKNFSKQFSVLPEEVVPSLYEALSSGVPKDNVFEFLEVAQKAARGGVTELATTVDGLSTVINSYGAENITAARASDVMFQTVKFGKVTFDELAGQMYDVVPAASAMGIGFEEVGAGLAALTAKGVPARVATTQIRSAIVELTKEAGPNSAFAKFKEISGKTFPEFVKQGGSLSGALKLMADRAKSTNTPLIEMFSSVEAGQGFVGLASDGLEAYNGFLGEMQNAAGSTEAAYEQMNKGLAPIWDKLKANAAVLRIEIGERIAPVLIALYEWLSVQLPRAGAIIAPILSEIAGGARAFGAAFTSSSDDVTSSGFAGTMERAGLVVRNFVMPFFNEGVTGVRRFAAAWKSADGLVMSTGFPGFMEKAAGIIRVQLLPGLRDNRELIEKIAAAIGSVIVAWKVAETGLVAVRAAIIAATIAQGLFNAVTEANPWVLAAAAIVLAIGAAVGAIIWLTTQTEVGRRLWDTAWEGIGAAVSRVWNEVLKPTVDWFADKWVNDVWPRVLATVTAFQEAWPGIQDALLTVYESAFKPLISYISDNMEMFKNLAIVVGVIAAIFVVLGVTVAAAAIIIIGIGVAIGALVSLIVYSLFVVLMRLVNIVWDVFNNVREAIGFVITKFLDFVFFISGLPDRVRAAAWGMWDGIKDSFRSALNWIIDHWNDLSLSVPKIEAFGLTVGGFSMDTPNIPRMASGGIITRPTLVLAGEAGAEAIVPLSLLRGGNTYNITVVSTGLGADSPQIQRDVMAAIRAYEQRNGAA